MFSPSPSRSGTSRSASVAPAPTAAAAATATKGDTKLEAASLGFGISKDGLAEIVLEKDVNVLARYGGVKGVLRKLKSDAEKGLRSEIVRRARRAAISCVAGPLSRALTPASARRLSSTAAPLARMSACPRRRGPFSVTFSTRSTTSC